MRLTLSSPRFALFAGLALTACATEHDPAEPTDDVESRIVELDIEDDVCPMDRHIVWLEEPGPCPVPDDGPWEAERLFHAGTPWLEENPIALSGELATVCRYQWTDDDDDPTQADVDTLYGQDAFADAGPDCEVIHPQAPVIRNDAITDAVDGELQAAFLAAAGFMQFTATEEDLRHPVTVAIVDTEPADENNYRTYHGEVMTRMIEAIACPSGAAGCAVELMPVLGLPRFRGGVDEEYGGHYASFGDLAAAIREATARWRVANMAPAEDSRLVINLSVGWNPDVVIDLDGPGERAVLLAIESARCAGAIVIAAAGNDDSTCSEEPLLPGGWEELPSPNNLRCNAVGTAGNGGIGTYNPLLHSVGGIGLDGRKLSIGREGGRPRLAAIASHGVVGDPDPSTSVLTGTSVSTAAVTAAAAILLSFRETMAPAAVMQAIYANGTVPVDKGQADYWLGTNRPNIRRADACLALKAACAGAQPCSALASKTCESPGPSEDDLATLIAGLGSAKPPPSPVITQSRECPIACGAAGATRTVYTADGVVASCEQSEKNPHDRYLTPQPPTPLCMSCSLTMPTTTGTARMDGSLNQEFANMPVESFVVDVVYDDGKLETLDYGDTVQLEPERVTTIEMPEIRTDAKVVSASVTIELVDRVPNTDVLIVDEKLSE